MQTKVHLAGVLLALCGCVAVSSGARTPESPSWLPRGARIQPASLVYGSATGADAYAAPGGLVVTGRTNFANPAFRTVARRGGSVLVYLDPVVDEAWGRYHRILLRDSACGPRVPRWPGSPRANRWGHLTDFRPGGVLQRKLRCVLELMVRENSHMAGWFLDDVGSRSWFRGFDWASWRPAYRRAYRAGAIALTRTMREVADEHGLIFLVNGTWHAGDLRRSGGGYPDRARDGNALADGGVVEHHDTHSAYFIDYACSSQWASRSHVRRGRAVNFVIASTWEGLKRYARSRCFAYGSKQVTYGLAPPWSGFRDIGLPSRPRR